MPGLHAAVALTAAIEMSAGKVPKRARRLLERPERRHYFPFVIILLLKLFPALPLGSSHWTLVLSARGLIDERGGYAPFLAGTP